MWSVIADTTPDVSPYMLAQNVESLLNVWSTSVTSMTKQEMDKHRELLHPLTASHLIKMVSSSYDYTSSMSGVFRGCQAMMQIHLESDIPYIPCTAYRINTTVEHSCDASEPVCALFDILQEPFVFITSSTKRYDVYGDKLKQSNEEPFTLKLRNLSGRRWVAREESIRAVWSSYALLLEVLEVLTNSKYDTKTRVKAAALHDKMKSFNFVVMLMFMKNVMGKTKYQHEYH